MKKWLDVLKEGATRAADKAQRTVEVTKLAAQISGKRKQIRDVHRQIGVAAHTAFRQGDLKAAEPEIARLTMQIDALERAIGNLELELQRLNREKTCSCGKRVPYSARFCPDCGKRFETAPETMVVAVEIEATIRCVNCDGELDEGDKFCLRCGSDQREEHHAETPGPERD
ncbi:zinc ribbon domain-containing protein [Paenibacillus hodogayensis]|uniref:Zinc ribbon domain-containing protein n=1 Tax=Paenibacillus hodogayensis TaxID=279208 RepID=A0ABV5VVX3_9BACL